ncbi:MULTISPECIES: GGDEF domain-containing protein [Luteimonas]|uniref:GGDEF domain-containing protein n=1 Tax=Luteimonas TaxID=83614 RepID=UPI0013042BC5|nr:MULTISPECIES: GGDEF domain-containing protein [Luteimonas]
MLQRLRSDYRLAIITLLGLSTALALSAFALYRVLVQAWPQALLDASVVVGILALVRLAWSPGRLVLAGNLMCGFNSAFCVVAGAVIGPEVNGWIYLALMSNFYIAAPRVAAICGMLLILCSGAWLFARGIELHAFGTLVTWSLVFAFSYSFSSRVHAHSGRLERLASVDALTQIPNRRAMETALRRAMHAGNRGRVGLLILDIDKFKRVNDTWGHATGDAVLSQLARVLDDGLRRDDAVFRFGGEEFVMLLASPSPDLLGATAERIRQAVETGVASPGGPVTVSIGGAMLDDEVDWQDWFAQADEALFRVKRSGGNQSRIGR